MQNGINHAGCSSITRNLREHKKEYKIKVRHVLIIKEKVHQNEKDQQKLVMTKVNASSAVIQLARKDSMKLLLFKWIKT